MATLFLKIPFIFELIFSGFYIVLFSFRFLGKYPLQFVENYADSMLTVTSYIIPFVIFISILANYIYSNGIDEFFRKYIFSLIVFIPLLFTIEDKQFVFWLSSAHLLSSILSLYDVDSSSSRDFSNAKSTTYNLFQILKMSPAQLVLLSFLLVIVFGTFGLMLPFATNIGINMSFWDALFIATSATCVTGLSTMNIGADFTIFGQILI